jgi:hypothetical protein
MYGKWIAVVSLVGLFAFGARAELHHTAKLKLAHITKLETDRSKLAAVVRRMNGEVRELMNQAYAEMGYAALVVPSPESPLGMELAAISKLDPTLKSTWVRKNLYAVRLRKAVERRDRQ